MSKELLNYIIPALIIIISIYMCIKYYKRCESTLEQIHYITLIITFMSPIIIYYVDKLDLPTKLGWNNNVNTQNWLSFLATYFSSIIGVLLSSSFLFLTTIGQMNRTTKENSDRDREERRINNMPLLKYSIEDNAPMLEEDKVIVIPTKFKSEYLATINFKIKNIGMNTSRKCVIKIKSNVLEKEVCFDLDEMQGTLCKFEEKEIQLLLSLKIKQKYKFNFEIYYEDLLSNYYMQDLSFDYELTSIFNQNNKCVSKKKLIVNTEKLLLNKPILSINLKNNTKQ